MGTYISEDSLKDKRQMGLAHSTYKKGTAVEDRSDSREGLAQRSRTERRRVPG